MRWIHKSREEGAEIGWLVTTNIGAHNIAGFAATGATSTTANRLILRLELTTTTTTTVSTGDVAHRLLLVRVGRRRRRRR